MAFPREVNIILAFIFIAHLFSVVLLSDISGKTFRRYNFVGVGCPSAIRTPRKHLCLVLCSTSPDCVAFSYNTTDGECIRCYGSNTTAISFGKPAYWRRVASVFQPTPNLDTYLYGNTKMLIKAEGKLLASGPNWLFLEISVRQTWVASVLMKMMLVSDNTVNLVALVNNAWTNYLTCTSPVTFAVGAYLDMAVLITPTLIHIYFNSMFCCSYTALLSKDDIVGAGLYGGFNFTELSI